MAFPDVAPRLVHAQPVEPPLLRCAEVQRDFSTAVRMISRSASIISANFALARSLSMTALAPFR